MITNSSERVNLLNVYLDNLSKRELLSRLGDGGMVVTPNVDHLMKLQKDPEFHQIYRKSDYVVCDSQVLFYASRVLGKPIQEKISGSDLFPAFYPTGGSRYKSSLKINCRSNRQKSFNFR